MKKVAKGVGVFQFGGRLHQVERVRHLPPGEIAIMKKVLLRASILALSCTLSIAALAQTKPNASVNVPAGDLATSLELLRKQTGLEIIYNASELRGSRSKQLSGSYSNEDALTRLLDGSGYTLKRDASGAYAIVKQAKENNKPPRKANKHDNSSSPEDEDARENVTNLPEILVQGSRSLNVDIARTKDDIQPYVVFSRNDIDLSLALNLEDFLSARLPMNQTKGTRSRSAPETDRGNRSGFNLRGLGENQTLILINGRRAPGVSTLQSGDISQADLNGIPLAAVERIEVLPTTASGIYGGGATGGVINVILRKDYMGNEIQLTYDNSFDTDSARRRLDFSSGLSLEGGNTHLMIAASYADGNDLLVRDRDFAQRGRALILANDPTAAVRTRIVGGQTNIFAAGTVPLTLRNGTALNSLFATVQPGYAGGDAGLGLVAGAGSLNTSVPDSITGGRQSLSSVPKTESLNLTVRRDFGDFVEGYVDYGTFRNEGTSMWSGFGATMSIPRTAPGNPFTQNIIVTFPLYGQDLERSNVSVSESERFNAGFIFKLPNRWNAGVDLNRNTSKNSRKFESTTFDNAAILFAVRSGALNVFRDLELYPLDLSPYLTGNVSRYGPSEGSSNEFAIRFAGPLAELPAGDLQISALISARKERAESTLATRRNEGGGGTTPAGDVYRFYPARQQSVRSAYFEVSAPLIAESQAIPLVKRFDVQASVRHDDYKTKSVASTLEIILPTPDAEIPAYSYSTSSMASTDFTTGFKYQPFDDLVVRASYGTGFLPPSLAQISESEQFILDTIFVADPRRGNQVAPVGPVLYTTGGSTLVRPEKSESFSAGLVYTPSFLTGLRLSADYTKINKKDEITSLTAQQLLQIEDALPGRVTRGDTLPDDPVGYAGVITGLDLTLFNTARSHVEAVDLQLDYEHGLGEWGELQLYGIATYQRSLEIQTVSTEPAIDRVGLSDGPLELRGNVGATWRQGAWNVSANTYWYGEYYVYSSTQNATSRALQVLGQGSDKIDSQTYTDVSAKYTISSGALTGLQVSAGVKNIFNELPPTIATTDSRGGFSTYGDPRGRVYVISLKKSF